MVMILFRTKMKFNENEQNKHDFKRQLFTKLKKAFEIVTCLRFDYVEI